MFDRKVLSLVFLAGLWGILCTDARAQRPVAATVDSAKSVIDYTGTAPLHSWTGTSRSVDGSFLLDPAAPDSSRAVIRVPVASFDSGNDTRDSGMREVTEAEKYPFVEFRGTEFSPSTWGKSSDGLAGRWTVSGSLTFHGKTHPVEDTVEVRVVGDTVRANAQFSVSLTRFGVERPGFMGFTVGDTIRVDARIRGGVRE
jgi:polyisoprenoid-binding protein YceI